MTDREIIKIAAYQLELHLKIAQLKDKKCSAVNNGDYEMALSLRDKERDLEKKQMPYMELLNMMRKQLNKKPISRRKGEALGFWV